MTMLILLAAAMATAMMTATFVMLHLEAAETADEKNQPRF
jgi:biopolymer transport protein ExbD